MSELNATELLTALAKLRKEYQARRDAVLLPVIDELNDLEDEYGPLLDVAEKQTRAAVLAGGVRVSGGGLVAIVTAGRTSWNTKELEKYAADNPTVNYFKTVGAPSVTIKQE